MTWPFGLRNGAFCSNVVLRYLPGNVLRTWRTSPTYLELEVEFEFKRMAARLQRQLGAEPGASKVTSVTCRNAQQQLAQSVACTNSTAFASDDACLAGLSVCLRSHSLSGSPCLLTLHYPTQRARSGWLSSSQPHTIRVNADGHPAQELSTVGSVAQRQHLPIQPWRLARDETPMPRVPNPTLPSTSEKLQASKRRPRSASTSARASSTHGTTKARCPSGQA